MKAARALFERQGYLDTSVGDIAKRARVAHGTFYTYFSSKEEIFGEVADDLQHQMVQVAEAEPHLPQGARLSERIERANRGYLRGFEQNARMMGVIEQVAMYAGIPAGVDAMGVLLATSEEYAAAPWRESSGRG